LKRLAFLGDAAGLGLAPPRGHAADAAAGPLGSATLAASPLADINDVHAWMEGSTLNLAMSVSPADTPAQKFGPEIQYVFHVHSKPMYGALMPGTGALTRVLCTFGPSR
jgi:hypothetical protein